MPIALFKRDEFRELIEEAAKQKGISSPAIVEKDYFVTEALRVISQKHGHNTIFKGGTSLSKGWGLIDRFSEDVDLYIKPAQTKNATEELLKQIANDVSEFEAFKEPVRVNGIKNIARSTRHAYDSKFDLNVEIKTSVLLEIGIQSGTYPTEERQIRSILSAVLVETNAKDLGEDCQAFPMQLLHYKRTAIEKMFALHDKVQRGFLQDGNAIGTYARHYYDIYQLLQQHDVQEMFSQYDHITICQSYRKLTQEFFDKQFLPDKMNLSTSMALFPDAGLAKELAKHYEEQCRNICYGEYPNFDEVMGELVKVRHFFDDIPDIPESNN